jgi:hypothetical protein
MAAIAYLILERAIIAKEVATPSWRGLLARIGRVNSRCAYFAAIPLAFVSPWIAGGLYVFVALLWLIPDLGLSGSWRTAKSKTRREPFRVPQISATVQAPCRLTVGAMAVRSAA